MPENDNSGAYGMAVYWVVNDLKEALRERGVELDRKVLEEVAAAVLQEYYDRSGFDPEESLRSSQGDILGVDDEDEEEDEDEDSEYARQRRREYEALVEDEDDRFWAGVCDHETERLAKEALERLAREHPGLLDAPVAE